VSTRRLSPAQRAAEALGQRLREIRTGANLTGRALAAVVDRHYTKVSRLEHGGKTPSEEELRIWCRICDTEDQIPDLIATLQSIQSIYQEFRRQTHAGMKRLMQVHVPLYERASLFRIYEHNVIPGLFQTADYAAAMLSFWISFLETPNDLEASVTARMERQRVIYQAGKRFSVLIEEQSLRTWFGAAEVQAGQLDRLLTVMSLPTVSVGIIPMMIERPCVSSTGFWIFDDELVCLETPTANIEVTRPSEVKLYLRMFGHLASVAVYGKAARHIITSVAEELPSAK